MPEILPAAYLNDISSQTGARQPAGAFTGLTRREGSAPPVSGAGVIAPPDNLPGESQAALQDRQACPGCLGRSRFYKRECQEKVFPLSRRISLFSAFSPFGQDRCCLRCICGATLDMRLGYHVPCVELPRLLKRANKQKMWSVCQPWFYLRLWPGPGLTAFLGYPRGHRVPRETGLKSNLLQDTHPRTLSASPAW
jgi:hypothetical protein